MGGTAAVSELDIFFQRIYEFIAELPDIIAVAKVQQRKSKLVAAETGYEVGFAQIVLQAPGDGFDDMVARVMPEGVVYMLKIVKVQKSDGQPFSPCGCVF